MAEPERPSTDVPTGPPGRAPDAPAVDLASIDWEAIERSPAFQELVRRRRAVILPCVAFYLAWFMGFILLCAYAPGFMGESVYEGLTVGYVLALTQFAMVFGLGLFYLRMSSRVFDPLAARAIEEYADLAPAELARERGRFQRAGPGGRPRIGREATP